MGKSAIIAPFYISVSWTLLVSYQLFTQTAVTSVVQNIVMFWPSIGNWLSMRMDIVVFIHTFAWIWVLSSMVPSVILGQGRSVLVQFLVCLILAFGAVSFADIFSFVVGTKFVEQILQMSVWFENAWLAGLYLLIPYLMMISVDLQERRKNKFKMELSKAVIGRQESPIFHQTNEKPPKEKQDLQKRLEMELTKATKEIHEPPTCYHTIEEYPPQTQSPADHKNEKD